MRPDRVWFSAFFCLKRPGYQLTTVCLKQGILTFKQEKRRIKICENCRKTKFVPFLLALMPEACTTTKLGKDFWLNVLRRGHKNLDAVLNRVGKSEISVSNRVRV